MEDEIELNYSDELKDTHPAPKELEETNILVLATTSDTYGMDFPSPANITRELNSLSETHLSTFKSHITRSLDDLKDQGYIKEKTLFGKDGAYQTTEKGESILNESNVFKYLEAEIE